MTKEDKGILGEKYVSQKIKEAIEYLGKDKLKGLSSKVGNFSRNFKISDGTYRY